MALTKLNAATINSIYSHLLQRAERQITHWGKDRTIHLGNGMLDISKSPSNLLPFSPRYYSRNQIPIDYEAGADCPRFIAELLEPCLNEEDIDLLQRYAGSLLLGGNRAQVFMIITGTAAGGKSTFVSILEKIIGELNTYELRTQHLHQRFEIYNYVGLA